MPIHVSAPGVLGGRIHEFEITPDGTRVVCVADHDTDGVDELYSAPLDGSAAPTKLNMTLAAGREIERNIAVSADGSLVVFLTDNETAFVREIYKRFRGRRSRLSALL